MECKHPEWELRKQSFSDGSEHFARQCLVCGGKASTWIKKPENAVSIPPWDETAAERYWHNLRDTQQQESQAEREARRADYALYLEGPEWAYKRALVLARDHYLCQGCLKNQATIAHHLTYAHIFDELLFELTSLCKDCHDKAHSDREQR
jgi:5-methylcytosine-specific restriction endonuclease McrA